MANEKVKIADITEKGDWINLKLEDGREVAVYKPKATKTAELLSVTNKGDERELNISPGKDGKLFAWDLQAQSVGGKKFGAPRDKSFEAAIAAANATAILFAGKTDEERKGIPTMFKALHDLIMSKATKPAENTNQ